MLNKTLIFVFHNFIVEITHKIILCWYCFYNVKIDLTGEVKVQAFPWQQICAKPKITWKLNMLKKRQSIN